MAFTQPCNCPALSDKKHRKLLKFRRTPTHSRHQAPFPNNIADDGLVIENRANVAGGRRWFGPIVCGS
jgi:hypothetical protein